MNNEKNKSFINLYGFSSIDVNRQCLNIRIYIDR